MSRVTTLLAGIICLAGCQGDAGKGEVNAEPSARARYDRMIATMRDATSLFYESEYRWATEEREIGHFSYRCWLKKPNQFRVELSSFETGVLHGVLVGDGEHLWIHWPGGRPRYLWEHTGEYAENYEKYRLTSYMKKPTPLAKHSIAHEIQRLGSDMFMTVLDPSTFHGFTASLQAYVDGARFVGSDDVAGTECDLIEITFMNQHRSWYLWLSKKDHLPRKLRQLIRGGDLTTDEVWSNVVVDAEMSDEKFAWRPPQDWHEWKLAPLEAGLLKPGTQAPEFALTAVNGETIRLADFRGNLVWLYKWHVG